MNVEQLIRMVDAKVKADARNAGHMTLGALIDALKLLPADTVVRYKNKDVGPASVASYRGFYSDLALDFGPPMTAAQLLPILTGAIGETFEGYKGGEFTMDRGTLVWAGTHSDCGDRIVGISYANGEALLERAPYEW